MLEGLKRWWSRDGGGQSDLESLAAWAKGRQFHMQAGKEAPGFVVDCKLGALPWRMEWGPSQRAYAPGPELRMRAELGVTNDLQVLVINRKLQEAMEHDIFEQYVEGVQTRIDDQTPPEMRWLVMFPKLHASEMGVLDQRFVALSSIKPWLQQWLMGALTDALAEAPGGPEQSVVLMIGRGKLTLRLTIEQPDTQLLEAWTTLFETALREARRLAMGAADTGTPSTQPSLFTASGPPGDSKRR
jgi:hypothetical protein